MPRYEFSEGSSNKFWEINLSGKSFTTTYGKIGTSGQTTIKSWKDNAEAKTQYEKLIAEKSKKGYELVGGGKSKAPVDDDEDEDEDEDDEDEAPAPKKKAARCQARSESQGRCEAGREARRESTGSAEGRALLRVQRRLVEQVLGDHARR